MKRYLALLICVTLLFSMVSSSMAATVFGGEVDFGYDIHRSLTYGYAKLIADNRINDGLTAHIAFDFDTIEKQGMCDEAWAELYNRYSTVRVGYWHFDVKGDVRVLSPVTISGQTVTAKAEIQQNCQLRIDIPVSEEISLMGFLTQQPAEEEFLYAGGASYEGDIWGAEAIYIKYDSSIGADPAIAVNAYLIPFDSTKAYLHYGLSQDRYGLDGKPDENNPVTERKSAIFGISYDSFDLPVYFRGEVNLYKGLYDDGNTPWGLVIGYKFRNGAKLQYDRYVHPYGVDHNTDIIKLIVCF
ncbi:MAG TPA: hypothetical protein DDW93_02910 [Firmicutes bacterium]|nr:hypothetical protein [Bacillota bacterium]